MMDTDSELRRVAFHAKHGYGGTCAFCGYLAEYHNLDLNLCDTCTAPLNDNDLVVCDGCGQVTDGYWYCEDKGRLCKENCQGYCTHRVCADLARAE